MEKKLRNANEILFKMILFYLAGLFWPGAGETRARVPGNK